MLPLQITKGKNGLSRKLVNNMCDLWLACKLIIINNWKIASFQWSEFEVEIWFQSSKLLLAYITFQRSKSNSRLLKVSAHIQSIARSCLYSELQYPATGCSLNSFWSTGVFFENCWNSCFKNISQKEQWNPCTCQSYELFQRNERAWLGKNTNRAAVTTNK